MDDLVIDAVRGGSRPLLNEATGGLWEWPIMSGRGRNGPPTAIKMKKIKLKNESVDPGGTQL